MSTNIYDTANQLERDLRETDAYKALQSAYAAVKENPESNDMFKEFQDIQIKLKQKQMSGEQILEEEIKEAQEMAMKTGENATIKTLMEAEQALSQLIDDINRIIMSPIQELYQG